MAFRQVSRLIGLAAVGLLLVSACEEETTTGVPVAQSMVTSAGDNQTGPVGSTLSASLEVTITGSNGQPFSGATVQFTVRSRTGSVSPTSATTGSDGKASTSLTLGTIAERVFVQARVGELTAEFGATALAGPVANVEVAGGDGQNGGTNVLLPLALAVRFTDANGNPVSGVGADWSTPDGGMLESVASDAEGVARAVWQLGPGGGAQSALASTVVGGVTFSAAAFAPCGSAGAPGATPHTIGSSDMSTLGDAGSSCVLGTGAFLEYFSVSPGSVAAGSFTVNTTAFSPLIDARDPTSGLAFAFAPNVAPNGSANNNLATVVLGAGATYQFQVSGAEASAAGAYTFTSSSVSVDNDRGCADGAVFVAPGVATTQQITTADCGLLFDGWFADWWSVYLVAGQTITLSETGLGFNPWITAFGPDGANVYFNGCPGVGASEVAVIGATVTGIYLFDIGTCDPGELGAYELSYTVAGPAPPQAAIGVKTTAPAMIRQLRTDGLKRPENR